MIDTSRVLIIGGSGMVGSQMDFGIRPSRAELDITDNDSVRRGFEQYQPAAAILLAGLVNVTQCEEHPEEAERVNVEGTKNVAKAAANASVLLIYFSSFFFFEGLMCTLYD
jgi:dTDP-4-dehydrorhamnose reductase